MRADATITTGDLNLKKLKAIMRQLEEPPAMRMQVDVSHLLPFRGTEMGPMKTSLFVTCSDEFRKKHDAWLREFFGDKEYPNPCLIHAVRTPQMIFVSQQLYEELRRINHDLR